MLITIIFMVTPLLLNGSISYEIQYDKSHIFFDKADSKDLIRIKGIGATGETGNPILPSEIINLLLPEGMEAESIAVEASYPYTLPGRYNIMPCPGSLDPLKDTVNTELYNSSMPYPGKRASILRNGSYKGNNIAQIATYPVDYFPKEGKITFYENINITLYTKFTGKNRLRQRNSMPLSKYIEKKTLKSIIDNDYDIPLSANYNKLRDTNNPEYIIITNDSMRSGFIPFANYLKKKGVIAEITVIEDIISASVYYDEVSSLYDDAAAVRGFLKEKYIEGIQWVLLGGDEDVIPVRYGTYVRNDTLVDNTAPSDLYYSDLNGNWNVDGDELYGEPVDDDIDVFPELFVGRVPCKNTEELNNWIEKLIGYETVPDKEKRTYLTKFLWTGSDNLRPGPRHTIINAEIPSYISHDTTMLEQPDGILPRGSDVINKMNENFGLFNLFGHGFPDVITVSCPGDNHKNPDRDFLVSVDSVENGIGNHQEYGNGLDSLKNKDAYSILSISSCFQAAFDYDKFPSRFPVGGPSIGEAFLMLPERGGPAFLGYTRYGGGYIEAAQVQIELLDKIFADSITNIGAAEALSKTEYNFYDTQVNHTLLGCPLMRVWTDIPKEMEASNYADSIPPESTKISIDVIEKNSHDPIANAYVCLWKGAEIYCTGFTDDDGVIDFQITPQTEGAILLTITKENFIPYSDTIRVSEKAGIDDGTIPAVSSCKTPVPVFNSEVSFDIHMPEKGNALLGIYDLTGRNITTIVDGELDKGIHSIQWKGLNAKGNAIPEGIYFFVFQYKDQISRGKFLFIK